MKWIGKNILSSISAHPLIIFIFISIIAYWQIAFLQYSLRWDAMDVVLPFRYFSADCLQNGFLPLWNPYQLMGSPVSADLQYSFWYPEILLTGVLFGYSNYTLHFLFILYLSIAGFGMYRLMGLFTNNKKVNLLTGIAYLLSGFFLAHAQLMPIIIAGAWIPYVLFYYLRLITHYHLSDCLKLALFSFLLMSGGYQSMTIILAYLVFTFFVFTLIQVVRGKSKSKVKKFIGYHLLLGLFMVVFALFIIIGYHQSAPFIDRYSGINLEKALFLPFPPKAFLSFVLPFSVAANHEFFGSNITMINAYFGLFFFIFFIGSLFLKKNSFEKIILFFGIFSLLAALGDYLPVREFLYHHVPFMDMFRFPAIFRYFSILSFLMLGGIFLARLSSDFKQIKSLLTGIGMIFLLLLFAVVCFALFKIVKKPAVFPGIQQGLFSFLSGLSLHQKIFFHGIIQFILLAGVLYLIVFSKKLRFNYLAFIIVVEMIVATQLNMRFSAVSEYSPHSIYQHMKQFPEGFMVPAQNEKIIQHSDISFNNPPFWRNTNIFHKRPSYDGFSSFKLMNYNYLFDSLPEFKNAILNNPVLYFPDSVLPYSKFSKDSMYHSGQLFLPDEMYKSLSSKSCLSDSSDYIEIMEFYPDKIKARVKTKSGRMLTLLQSNYHGWKVNIDDEQTEIIPSNYLFMSTMVPSGTHTVVFNYENNTFSRGFYLVYGLLIVLLGAIILMYIRQIKKHKNLFLIAFTIIIILLTLKIIINSTSIKRQKQKELKLVDHALQAIKGSENSTMVLLNMNKSQALEQKLESYHHAFLSFRFKENEKLARLFQIVEQEKDNKILYLTSNLYNPAVAESIIELTHPKSLTESTFNNTTCKLFQTGRPTTKTVVSSLNEFENKADYWTTGKNVIDTALAYSGQKCYLLDSLTIYGAGFNFTLNKKGRYIITANLKALSKDMKKSFIVLQIDRNDEMIHWEGTPVHEFDPGNNEWFNAVLYKEMYKKLIPGDIVSVYVWNEGRGTIFIDDFKVTIDFAQSF